MTDGLRMGLEDLLRKAEIEHDVDFLRQGVQLLSQALMELEFSGAPGPSPPAPGGLAAQGAK